MGENRRGIMEIFCCKECVEELQQKMSAVMRSGFSNYEKVCYFCKKEKHCYKYQILTQ